MITIPLYTFLGLYALFLLGIAVFFFINVAHLAHTGTLTLVSFIATLAFLIFSTLILWETYTLLQAVNWQTPIVVWNGAWLGNAFGSFISPTL